MARLRTVGWETQKLSTTAAQHGEGGSVALGIASVGPGVIDTTVPRSGLACFAASGVGFKNELCQLLGATLGRAYFQRAGFRFTATQSNSVRIMSFTTVGSIRIGTVNLTTSDTLQLQDFNFAAVGADSPVLSHDHWYRLELKAVVHAVPTSSNGILEARLYDDTTGLLIWNPSSSAADLSTTAVDRAQLGYIAGAVFNGTLYVDDWAINDDTAGTGQTSWPGNGKQVLLKPVSDNARVGFTGGAGGTTSLFEAVNNYPPVGVVSASGTNTSQVATPNNNSTDTYDADVGAYSDSVASGGGGLVAGDIVMTVAAMARYGNSTTTQRNIGINNTSNPAGSESIVSSTASTAVGTESTGWQSRRNAVQYAPSVTLGTKPVVRIRKATSSTDVLNCDLMGLMVDYRPLQTGTASVSGSGSVAAAGQRDARASASLTGLGSLSATGQRDARATVALTGQGSVSATGLRDARATASLTGVGTLAATGQRTTLGSAALAGLGSLSASGTPTHFGGAALQGQGSLAAVGQVEGVASAALSGSGTIGASGVRQTSGAAALSGTGSLAASGTRATSGSAALAGTGSLSATGTRSTTGGAALAGAGSVAGSGRLTTFSGAGVSGTGTLAGSGITLLYGSAALSGSGLLLASGLLTRKGAASVFGAGLITAKGRVTLGKAPWFVGPIDMEPIHLDSEIDLVR